MIRNNNFVKRKIGTQYVIVAVGEATRKFNGMISVNGTGSFIWDCLENHITMDELVLSLTAAYDIDAETARRDAAEFIDTLKGVGAIE